MSEWVRVSERGKGGEFQKNRNGQTVLYNSTNLLRA